MNKETLDIIKNYVNVNELGHIVTKALNVENSGGYSNLNYSRAKLGKRRGSKTKYGWRFTFHNSDIEFRVNMIAREFVWLYYGNDIPEGMKVKPINGDVLDDRIENLYVVKDNTGRPRGVKETKKRATRNSLSVKEDKMIVKYRKSFMSIKDIMDKMNCTKSQVLGVIKRYRDKGDIKPFFDARIMTHYDPKKHLAGVYAIVSHCLNSSGYSRAYIGSSRNIKKRIESHKRNLSKNKHYNTQMQEDYNKKEILFKYYVIEHGEYDHGEILKLESEFLNKFEQCSLYNSWRPPVFEEIKPFLDKAVEKHLSDDSNYTVTECGCWEWKQKNSKDGYGNEKQIRIGGELRHVKPHRFSYYKATGEYPELIRHKCDNKLCVNPDHLLAGSHQQNALDKSKQFRKDFEYWWLRYEASVGKLTEHFGFLGSSQIYYWEKQLGLRDKHKDVFESEKSRRKNGNK